MGREIIGKTIRFKSGVYEIVGCLNRQVLVTKPSRELLLKVKLQGECDFVAPNRLQSIIQSCWCNYPKRVPVSLTDKYHSFRYVRRSKTRMEFTDDSFLK